MSSISLIIGDRNPGAITSYSELKTKVANWLNRSDLDDIIPDFIKLAETELDRRLSVKPVRPMMARSNTVLESGYLTLPADFIKPITIEITIGEVTTSLKAVNAANGSLVTRLPALNDGPSYYSIINNELSIYPADAELYTVRMTYYQRLPDLYFGTVNWLLEQHPDCYLYSSLAYGSAYVHDDAGVQRWTALFDRALEYVWEAYPERTDTAPLVSDLPLMDSYRWNY